MEQADGSQVSQEHATQSALAAVAAFGTTWLLRRGMTAAYLRRTGRRPPARFDRSVPLREAMAWAVATAVAVSVLQVLLDRLLSRSTSVRR